MFGAFSPHFSVAVVYESPLPGPLQPADSEGFAFVVRDEIQMFPADVLSASLPLSFIQGGQAAVGRCTRSRVRASEGRAVAGRASDYTLITRAGPR